jgi:hypothetical protein
MWRKEMKAAGVNEMNEQGERRDFYALRHTSITRVRRAAGSKAAQEHAGHSTPMMTARYDHLNSEDLKKMVAALPVAPKEIAALALQSGGKTGPDMSQSVQSGDKDNSENKPDHSTKNPAFAGSCEMGRAGIEPATHGFSVHCSTN